MAFLLILSLILNPFWTGVVFAEKASNSDLSFSVALWADEVRDKGDFDLNPDGIFKRGERAYAYLELEGFSWEEQEGYLHTDVHVDVALRTKGGFRLFFSEDLLEFDSLYLNPPENFWFYIYVDVPWWAPRGTYITEIIVRDEISGETLIEHREIQVR
ncbi:MAG: hypothetical protein GX335_10200 [Firmicutes bacterium]|nr:hypothetical protein [Bacillota bacterium]